MQQHRQARAAKNSKHVCAFTLISIFGLVMKFTQFLFRAISGPVDAPNLTFSCLKGLPQEHTSAAELH